MLPSRCSSRLAMEFSWSAARCHSCCSVSCAVQRAICDSPILSWVTEKARKFWSGVCMRAILLAGGWLRGRWLCLPWSGILVFGLGVVAEFYADGHGTGDAGGKWIVGTGFADGVEGVLVKVVASGGDGDEGIVDVA